MCYQLHSQKITFSLSAPSNCRKVCLQHRQFFSLFYNTKCTYFPRSTPILSVGYIKGVRFNIFRYMLTVDFSNVVNNPKRLSTWNDKRAPQVIVQKSKSLQETGTNILIISRAILPKIIDNQSIHVPSTLSTPPSLPIPRSMNELINQSLRRHKFTQIPQLFFLIVCHQLVRSRGCDHIKWWLINVLLGRWLVLDCNDHIEIYESETGKNQSINQSIYMCMI